MVFYCLELSYCFFSVLPRCLTLTRDELVVFSLFLYISGMTAYSDERTDRPLCSFDCFSISYYHLRRRCLDLQAIFWTSF